MICVSTVLTDCWLRLTFSSRCRRESVAAHHITSVESTETPTAHPNTIKLRAPLNLPWVSRSTRLTFITTAELDNTHRSSVNTHFTDRDSFLWELFTWSYMPCVRLWINEHMFFILLAYSSYSAFHIYLSMQNICNLQDFKGHIAKTELDTC